MNFKELGDNLYEKSTDSVERYLLNMVQAYLQDKGIQNNPDSREYIVDKSVQRMKEEYGLIQGVKSVNGKTGVVDITIEEVNAEPKIENKKTAFNVNFGTIKGTACEGDDPRLSDARKPLQHNHVMDDIAGLQGIIATLNASTQQVNKKAHVHENKSVLDKITYSGNNSSIDLTDIENKTTTLNQMITGVESKNTIALNQMTSKFEQTQTAVSDSNINSLQTDADNKINNAKIELQQYANTKVTDAKSELQQAIDLLAKQEDVDLLLDEVENIETFIGEQSVLLSNVLDSGDEYAVSTDQTILDELDNYGITDLRKCIIEIEIDENGKKTSGTCFLTDAILIGFISTYVTDKNVNIRYNRIDSDYTMSEAQRNIKITIKYYAKKKVI